MSKYFLYESYFDVSSLIFIESLNILLFIRRDIIYGSMS